MISRLPVRRSGLTLMELVVVLAILAATAAILVPLFPNLTRRAHKSTESAQITELAKAIQLYQAANITYPDGWDLMTNSTSATAPTFLPADGGVFGGFATIAPIQATEVSALNKMGVTQGHHFAATTSDATGNPYELPLINPATGAQTASDLVGGTTNVFYLNNASFTKGALATVIAQNTDTGVTPRFIVFGVGPRCSLVGQTIQDAPILSPENKKTPDNTYARFGAIFMVSGKEVDKTGRARFIGCVALEDDEIETSDEAIVGYYKTVQ